MADLKSFNATPIVSSSTRRARMIGGAATAAATAVLALMVVLDFNGCSKSNGKNAQVNPTTQNSGAPVVEARPAPGAGQFYSTIDPEVIEWNGQKYIYFGSYAGGVLGPFRKPFILESHLVDVLFECGGRRFSSELAHA